jgi:tRNA G10  N-methylase Trm11
MLGKLEHLSMEIAEFVEALGFHCLESHKVYVHRTLTREVLVYEKL